MPISLGEWRARIGRFVHWKQVAVDIDRLIETILERRRQLYMREVDDILENTRKNAAEQEARGASARTSSGQASASDDQCGSDSSGSSTTATAHNSTSPTTSEPGQSNAPDLLSTSPFDEDPSMSAPQDDEEFCDRPTIIPSSTSRGSNGQGHQCNETLNRNSLDETHLHTNILLSERVRIECKM